MRSRVKTTTSTVAEASAQNGRAQLFSPETCTSIPMIATSPPNSKPCARLFRTPEIALVLFSQAKRGDTGSHMQFARKISVISMLQRRVTSCVTHCAKEMYLISTTALLSLVPLTTMRGPYQQPCSRRRNISKTKLPLSSLPATHSRSRIQFISSCLRCLC